MTALIESYLQDVRRRLPGTADKDAIIAELRTHLEDRIAERGAPSQTPEQQQAIVREVLRDFGEASELALAYENDSPVLQRSGGEVALRLTKSAARSAGVAVAGASRFLRPILITLMIIVGSVAGIALVAGIVLFDDIRELAERHAPETVYDHHRHCNMACNETLNESFYVGPGAREVRLGVDIDASSGTFRVIIRDPDGAVRLDRLYSAGDDVRMDNTVAPTSGTWTTQLTYGAFQGQASVEASTLGLS